MFWAMFSPIFKSNFTLCTASVQCTEAVRTVKLILKMGENTARNM
jgi:hypothetical protein